MRWDYYSPTEDQENEVDDDPDIEAAIAEELEVPLQNLLSLRIHPRLRKAAFRKAAEEDFTENKNKLKDRNS